jgi:phosphatidate cytidylyltransferase
VTANSTSKWSDLAVRVSSALVLAPLALAAVWLGGYWYSVFIILLGVMIAREWTDIVHGGNSKQFFLHAAAALLAATAIGSAEIALIIIPMVLSIALVIAGKQPKSAWSICGVAYVALPILALTMLRTDNQWGLKAISWCMVIVWAADTLAYFAGRIIGGPKLAPKLSPKKTWAGMGGAIVGAALASAIFSAYFGLSYMPLMALAAQFAVVEQGGDILESALKRHYNVKDSGDLIPGHGGVLDRVDGLLAVVFVACLLGYLHNPANPALGLLRW